MENSLSSLKPQVYLPGIPVLAFSHTEPCISLTQLKITSLPTSVSYYNLSLVRLCLDDEYAYALKNDEYIPIDKRNNKRGVYIVLINSRTNVISTITVEEKVTEL